MPPKALRTSLIPVETQGEYSPLIPAVVLSSYKGGVGKTALAVALAERLAWAGLRVLLLTCDSQEDARARLGVRPSEPQVASRGYGEGSVTVFGLRGSRAIDLVYRLGPERLGYGAFDVVILDTPPEIQGGRLPGVFLIAPLDGVDAARNLVTMLMATPANTEIVLVKMGRSDADEWREAVEGIENAIGRTVAFLPKPLPRTKPVHKAHDEGVSVWTLRRTAGTVSFLIGVDALAQAVWSKVTDNRPWPTTLPPATASGPHVRGWDDED